MSIDLIERKRTPTREESLTARLKSLREQTEASSPVVSSKAPTSYVAPQQPSASQQSSDVPQKSIESVHKSEDDVETAFQTDDKELEELLGDIDTSETFSAEPSDDQVKALLDELEKSIPKDTAPGTKEAEHVPDRWTDQEPDSDDSDGDDMTRDADEVVAKLRDEMEVEASSAEDRPEVTIEEDSRQVGNALSAAPDLTLPSVPSNLEDLPTVPSARAGSADLDDITARMAALRAAPDPVAGDEEESFVLPSVPCSAPSGKPINRLATKTKYTDDDMDGWCTVCLEDATLQCRGCDDDVYCTRCWREMHIGPAAGFDERSHKAVHFNKDKKAKEKPKKVALGA